MAFEGFTDQTVVDGHIHFPHPELAASLVAVMDEIGVVRANLVAVPDLQRVNQNPALIHFKAHYPGRAYISGALDYTKVLTDDPDAPRALAAQIGTLRDIGFDGLKVVEGKPTVRRTLGLPFDGTTYAQMWATLEEMGFPVVFHVGDPEEFWDPQACPDWARAQGWFYGGGGCPSKERLYAEVETVLDRYPGQRVVFAHFYFLSADMGRAAAFLDAHPQVYFDLTPGVEMYLNFAHDVAATRDFFIKYADRIIYGTDIGAGATVSGPGHGLDRAESAGRAWVVKSFLETDGPYSAPEGVGHWLGMDAAGFHGVALPPDVLEKVYHLNFEWLFGSNPAPLDHGAAITEVERLATLIETRSGASTQNTARRVGQQLKGEDAGGAVQ